MVVRENGREKVLVIEMGFETVMLSQRVCGTEVVSEKGVRDGAGSYKGC